jgi:hypothetical protein
VEQLDVPVQESFEHHPVALRALPEISGDWQQWHWFGRWLWFGLIIQMLVLHGDVLRQMVSSDPQVTGRRGEFLNFSSLPGRPRVVPRKVLRHSI